MLARTTTRKKELKVYRTKKGKLRAGVILCLLVYFSCLLAAPALADGPEQNGYVADKPLTEYSHGTVKGDLYYTIGTSKYSGKIYGGNVYSVSLNVNLPEGASIKFARLYDYWTWSAELITGRDPEMNLSLNGQGLEPEVKYSDRKLWGIYDYPSGTWAYNVTDYVSGSGSYSVEIENTGPAASFICFDGVGLLIVYEDPNGKDIEYWISEGADMLNSQTDENGNPLYYVTPNQTICEMLTPTIQFPINKATLWTVIQSGNWPDNILIVNNKEIPGICNGRPYADLDLDTRDVTADLVSGENNIRFQAVGDYVVPSNSFLIVETVPGTGDEKETSSETTEGTSEDSNEQEDEQASSSPGPGFGTTLALLAAGKLAVKKRWK